MATYSIINTLDVCETYFGRCVFELTNLIPYEIPLTDVQMLLCPNLPGSTLMVNRFYFSTMTFIACDTVTLSSCRENILHNHYMHSLGLTQI